MELALGTVQFGMPYGLSNRVEKVPFQEASAMIEEAKRSGIGLIDTAISYGDSETILGNIGMRDFKVITKIPEIPGNLSAMDAWIEDRVKESIERLQIDSIYGVLLHSPSQLLDPAGIEIVKALDRLKNKGIVQKTGISIYSPEELESLSKISFFDIVQLPVNVIDRRIETSGWLKRLKLNGTEIHARSVFLQGLLLKTASQVPSYFTPWMKLLESWHRWLDENEVSATDACISYLKSLENIDVLVIGASTSKQLSEVITSLNKSRSLDYPAISSDDPGLVNPGLWA